MQYYDLPDIIQKDHILVLSSQQTADSAHSEVKNSILINYWIHFIIHN